jgi:hypothetical protein
MADRPKDDEAFEEALDAAEVFTELDAEEADSGAQAALDEQAFTDDFELPGPSRPEPQPAPAAPAAKPQAAPPVPAAAEAAVAEAAVAEVVGARLSIGGLFKAAVRRSPPSRIRIEADSVGALFRRFIERS